MPAIAVGSLGGGELAVSYSVPPPSGDELEPVALTITMDEPSERWTPVSKSIPLNERLRGRVRVRLGLGPPPTEVRATTVARNNLVSDHIVVKVSVRVAPQERADVVQVKRRYGLHLIPPGSSPLYPGAVGLGVGTDEKHTGQVAPSEKAWVIVVFVKSAADVPARPKSIGGVPIQFVVSGPIAAQPLEAQ